MTTTQHAHPNGTTVRFAAHAGEPYAGHTATIIEPSPGTTTRPDGYIVRITNAARNTWIATTEIDTTEEPS